MTGRDEGDGGAGSVADRLWSFSVASYGGAGVAPACLALQDGLGLDVNILLFCCFAASEGLPALRPEAMAQAEAAVRPWRQAVVEPLRGVRRAMRDGFAGVDDGWRETLRKQVQAAELDSERIVQSLLAARLGGGGIAARPGRLEGAAANVASYLAAVGAVPGAADIGHLAVVLAGAIAGADEATAARALRRALEAR